MESKPYRDNMPLPFGNASSLLPDESKVVNWLFWITTILRYWYFIVLGLLFGLMFAYWQNQKWTPVYNSSIKLMYEQGNKVGAEFLNKNSYMPNQNNMSNQIFMLSSYDLIHRTLSNLNLTVDMYEKGMFRSENLYKIAPVEIIPSFIAESAYGQEFTIESLNSRFYKISFAGNKTIASFSLKGEYGKPIQHSLFFVIVNKTDLFTSSYNFTFRFNSLSSLVDQYMATLSVRPIEENSSILSISRSSEVPRRDLDFLSALCSNFIKENLAQKNKAAEKTIEFIESQLLIISDSVSASQSRLMNYQASNRMYSNDVSVKASTGIDDLEKKKAELQMKKVYLEYLTNYLKNNVQDGAMIAPVNVGVSDAGLSEFVTKYNDMARRLKEMGDKNPLFSKYQSQISELKELMNETVRNMYNVYQLDKGQVDRQYSQVIGQMSSAPEKERKYLLLERNYKIHETYNAFLIQKRAEAQIQKASNMADYYVLENARVIGSVNSTAPKKNFLLFGLLGLLLPVLIIVLREILDFSIKSVDEVERISRYPLVGKIIVSNKPETIIVKNYPKSSYAEAFRAMRTRLEFVVGNRNKSSFIITSAEPGDGKTYIALNLASIFQMTGKKVVLVDFDLRKPAVAKVLKEEVHRGVSNYLIGQVELKNIIHPYPDYGFDIIFAGTLPPNPGELTQSQATKDLIEELKTMYDCVILDCSPIGLVSDAHPLSYLVDTVLFVVRKNKTNRTFFRNIINQLKADDIKNVAVVVNGLDKTGTYNYNGGKSYYYQTKYHKDYYKDNYFENV
ncbi:MAG: polysaccharide biosynthesis tyrosine autokinase [Bacteroidota bacterium]|nr:polysaccharide biosynthesis tyrosine autokinase [Bacteroidota bacterium]